MSSRPVPKRNSSHLDTSAYSTLLPHHEAAGGECCGGGELDEVGRGGESVEGDGEGGGAAGEDGGGEGAAAEVAQHHRGVLVYRTRQRQAGGAAGGVGRELEKCK